MRFSSLLVGVLAVQLLACHARAMVPDVYRITDEVLVKQPPRFAVNVDFGGGYAPWNIDRMINAWNLMVSGEPLQFQHNGIADGGGEDYLEHKSMPGLSYWDCARSGFWDGADLYIYRVVEGKLALIRKAVIALSLIGNTDKGEKTEERVYFTRKGPAIQAGDLYVLRMQRNSMPSQMRPNLMPKGYPFFDGIVDKVGKVDWSIDTGTHAPEGGSAASLKMVCRDGTAYEPASLWHWFMVSNSHDSAFFPDKSYRMQVWLRQEGVSNGEIRIQMGTITNMILQADSQWRKFEVDLPVHHPQQRYQTFQGGATRLMIGVVGSGTVWIDNFLIYQTDTPPFAVLPTYLKLLKEWHPQVLRLWGGFSAPTLEAWLFKGFKQPSRGGIGGTTAPSYASLDVELQLCVDTGADPWLILNPFYTDEELAHLMEYLGAPASQGYGALRAAQGRREPWTSVFKTITIECGNEGWNGIFSPRAWPGNPTLYSHIADRLFAGLKNSPYYRKDAFEFVANGWDSSLTVGGWTHRVAEESREATRIDMAMYFGGWEKGVGGDGGPDEVYQDRLLATPIEYGPKLINTLLMDPDLISRLGKTLQERPELVKQALAAVKVQSPASGPSPLPVDQRLTAIMQLDPARRAMFIRCMKGMREAIDKPAWDVARIVLGTSPAFKPRAGQVLGMDPEVAGQLVVRFNNLGSAPGEMTGVLRKHPEVVEGLVKALPFTESEIQTLRKVSSGGQLDYFVVNKIGKHVSDAAGDYVAAGDQAFLTALREGLTPQNMRHALTIVGCNANGALFTACESYTGALLQGMKDDPVFARAVCAELAQHPDFFHDPARGVTAGMSEGLLEAWAHPFEVVPWGSKILMLDTLPRDLVADLRGRVLDLVRNPDMGASPEVQSLVAASYALQAGDTAPVLAISNNTAVAQLLERRMQSTIMAPFLDAAGEDARVGDALLRGLQRVPPGPRAKGLAVYEAGPGYSLPGPGKPINDEDENMGKSLASGTATLDAFMLALSRGASPIGYYNFKSGDYWASQKHPQDPIPYPTWLALEMRNLYAKGDLMLVEPEAVQVADIPDKKVIATTNDGKGSEKLVKGRKGVAMTACYAFRDGSHHAFMLINRDFKAARQIKLDLSYRPAGRAMLYTLTNPDPKAHNRVALEVKVESRQLDDFSNGYVVTVPPASVYLITE